ncbi:hypothetical protein F8388_012010 [Cannabis sativa]|uniref:MATH domain-containing protein n=1 Tax=Cannabis sativa TaxID=3483 RepID=A0A7J6GE32_CANSA|nr:hypothetical protein F8388_012010 [Cannabis sativa]
MDTEISRCMRNVPPSHYLMKVKSFSLLSKRLSFYPNGDKRLITDNNYISLYLTICETETLPNGWEVNVNFSLFVYNHLHDNYLTLQATRRFHKIKKEWGFDKIESLESFKNVSNGYLHNDCCVFGAEVFIINPTPSFETLSVFERGDIILRDCFICGKGGWGFPNFILLENLHKSSNGYVVNDTLIVEVEFYLVSQTKFWLLIFA